VFTVQLVDSSAYSSVFRHTIGYLYKHKQSRRVPCFDVILLRYFVSSLLIQLSNYPIIQIIKHRILQHFRLFLCRPPNPFIPSIPLPIPSPAPSTPRLTRYPCPAYPSLHPDPAWQAPPGWKRVHLGCSCVQPVECCQINPNDGLVAPEFVNR
jgi:hypothetical protein